MALNIYEPMKFRSQGIEDLATHETLVITNGKITVDTVEPKKAVSFAGANFAEIEGNGIRWTDGRKAKTLAFKESKLWTDLTLNLDEEQEYQINNTTVLSFTELGSTVTKSNLKQVGVLKNLRVAGNASFGDFAYAMGSLNRFGINTDAPGAALGIVENSVEILLGSLKQDTAIFGTHSNDHLEIITDNTTRITVTNSGEVVIGSANHKNGILRVNGTLYADAIVTERSSPLVFKESDTSSNYGKGIIWAGKTGPNKQLVYQANPDRIWSTDIIDLAQEKYFAIENQMVLSKTSLGTSVVESSLTKLGILKDLQVAGDAAITRKLSTSRIEIGKFAVDENRLEFDRNFSIQQGTLSEFRIGSDITIGNSDNTTRAVSVYGRLAVGTARPGDDVSLTVSGPVSFENKKFKVGSGIPTFGDYNKGDVVWNDDPKAGSHIGWVCITAGSPGFWLPFGYIGSR
jgi:hypothetical protein